MVAIALLNLLLCIIIVFLGIWAYKENNNKVPLYIALAYCMFGVSHLGALIGIEDIYTGFFILLRMIAYIVVIFAMMAAAK